MFAVELETEIAHLLISTSKSQKFLLLLLPWYQIVHISIITTAALIMTMTMTMTTTTCFQLIAQIIIKLFEWQYCSFLCIVWVSEHSIGVITFYFYCITSAKYNCTVCTLVAVYNLVAIYIGLGGDVDHYMLES